jgi:hypothetical protein
VRLKEAAIVTVTAKTIGEAHDIALSREFYSTAKFALGEGNDHKVYLPDSTDYENLKRWITR